MPSRASSDARSPATRAALAATLFAAALVFLFVVQRHQALGDWLLFHYLRAWTLAALFGLACLVSGHTLLLRALGRSLPFEEHVTLAFALGLLGFFFVSFTAGVLGLYGQAFFLGCPALLLAVGARRFLQTSRRLGRHLATVRHRLHVSATNAVIVAFGCVGIALVWFPILTPQNASYDARWYHLSIAQHYLAQGRISPFQEGWVPGALPQLASLVYAWGLAAPGELFERV